MLDFRGFDSSIILSLRGGIPRPIVDFPESLSHAILVGIMLVGRLGVKHDVNHLYAYDKWIKGSAGVGCLRYTIL